MSKPSPEKTEETPYAGYGGYYATPEEASKSIREHSPRYSKPESDSDEEEKPYEDRVFREAKKKEEAEKQAIRKHLKGAESPYYEPQDSWARKSIRETAELNWITASDRPYREYVKERERIEELKKDFPSMSKEEKVKVLLKERGERGVYTKGPRRELLLTVPYEERRQLVKEATKKELGVTGTLKKYGLESRPEKPEILGGGTPLTEREYSEFKGFYERIETGRLYADLTKSVVYGSLMAGGRAAGGLRTPSGVKIVPPAGQTKLTFKEGRKGREFEGLYLKEYDAFKGEAAKPYKKELKITKETKLPEQAKLKFRGGEVVREVEVEPSKGKGIPIADKIGLRIPAELTKEKVSPQEEFWKMVEREKARERKERLPSVSSIVKEIISPSQKEIKEFKGVKTERKPATIRIEDELKITEPKKARPKKEPVKKKERIISGSEGTKLVARIKGVEKELVETRGRAKLGQKTRLIISPKIIQPPKLKARPKKRLGFSPREILPPKLRPKTKEREKNLLKQGFKDILTEKGRSKTREKPSLIEETFKPQKKLKEPSLPPLFPTEPPKKGRKKPLKPLRFPNILGLEGRKTVKGKRKRGGREVTGIWSLLFGKKTKPKRGLRR